MGRYSDSSSLRPRLPLRWRISYCIEQLLGGDNELPIRSFFIFRYGQRCQLIQYFLNFRTLFFYKLSVLKGFAFEVTQTERIHIAPNMIERALDCFERAIPSPQPEIVRRQGHMLPGIPRMDELCSLVP